jgi:hypothetical protein
VFEAMLEGWAAAEVEAFVDGMRAGSRPTTVAAARGYLTDLQLFLRYGRPASGAVLRAPGRAPEIRGHPAAARVDIPAARNAALDRSRR